MICTAPPRGSGGVRRAWSGRLFERRDGARELGDVQPAVGRFAEADQPGDRDADRGVIARGGNAAGEHRPEAAHLAGAEVGVDVPFGQLGQRRITDHIPTRDRASSTVVSVGVYWEGDGVSAREGEVEGGVALVLRPAEVRPGGGRRAAAGRRDPPRCPGRRRRSRSGRRRSCTATGCAGRRRRSRRGPPGRRMGWRAGSDTAARPFDADRCRSSLPSRLSRLGELARCPAPPSPVPR